GVVVKAVGYFVARTTRLARAGERRCSRPQPPVPRAGHSDSGREETPMATANKKKAGPKTHEGAPAARLTPLETLQRSVLACLLWEDTFYEAGEHIVERIGRLAREVRPEDVVALAVEARERMKLRHAPLWLCRALAKAWSPLVAATLE